MFLKIENGIRIYQKLVYYQKPGFSFLKNPKEIFLKNLNVISINILKV